MAAKMAAIFFIENDYTRLKNYLTCFSFGFELRLLLMKVNRYKYTL